MTCGKLASCALIRRIRHSFLLKTFSILHYSNNKLAKLYPNVTPECPRCKTSPTPFGHMFWFCQLLHIFRTSVFKPLSAIGGKTIIPCPLTATLDAGKKISHLLNNPVSFASLLFHHLILFNWKKKESSDLCSVL